MLSPPTCGPQILGSIGCPPQIQPDILLRLQLLVLSPSCNLGTNPISHPSLIAQIPPHTFFVVDGAFSRFVLLVSMLGDSLDAVLFASLGSSPVLSVVVEGVLLVVLVA